MPSTEDHGELRRDFPGGWEDDKVNAFDDIGLSSTQIETKSFVKKLLNWRKSNQAIASGKLIHYPVTNGIYVYFRVFQRDKLMVIMNNKENEEILNLDVYRETFADRKNGFDIISGKKYNLSKDLILNPKTALILELEWKHKCEISIFLQ